MVLFSPATLRADSAKQSSQIRGHDTAIQANSNKATEYGSCHHSAFFCNTRCALATPWPTLLGTELRGLPASSANMLWEASDRQAWTSAYNGHSHQWGREGQLRIEELWPISQSPSQAQLESRRDRVDQWVSCLDEFGTMLFAVTSCTHGG